MSGWYLQDTRVYYGNCMVWWKQDGRGYTSDLTEAHVFTDEEAVKGASRETDVFWPKDYIDAHARPRVDFQVVKMDEARVRQARERE